MITQSFSVSPLRAHFPVCAWSDLSSLKLWSARYRSSSHSISSVSTGRTSWYADVTLCRLRTWYSDIRPRLQPPLPIETLDHDDFNVRLRLSYISHPHRDHVAAQYDDFVGGFQDPKISVRWLDPRNSPDQSPAGSRSDFFWSAPQEGRSQTGIPTWRRGAFLRGILHAPRTLPPAFSVNTCYGFLRLRHELHLNHRFGPDSDTREHVVRELFPIFMTSGIQPNANS